MAKPGKLPLGAWAAFEDLEIYLLDELEKRQSRKYRYTWEDRLVGLLDDCEMQIATANAADAKGTKRRLALGQAEQLFYKICLKLRKGYRLGIFTQDQYGVIVEMISRFEALFISWVTKYNPNTDFIRRFEVEGRVEFDKKTFSRVVQ